MKRNLIYFMAIIILAGFVSLRSGTSEKEHFAYFIGRFPTASLPFQIKGNEIPVQGSSHYYNRILGAKAFIPELTQSDFGRSVTSNCSYVAKLYDCNKFVTVCYKVINDVADAYATNKYMVVSYNKQTFAKIDRIEFAGQATPDIFSSGVFTENNIITVSRFKNTWESDPVVKGYKENKVIKIDLLSTFNYKLDENGKFVKSAIPAGGSVVNR